MESLLRLVTLVSVNIKMTMFRDVPLLAIICIHVVSDFAVFSLSLSNIVGGGYLLYLVTGLLVFFAVSYSVVSVRPLAASKMADRIFNYLGSLPIPRTLVPLSFIVSATLISIIASSIPIPLYYLYIYTLSPSPPPGPSIVPLLLLPLALIALAVSSIMAMAAYLTDNFAVYLSVGSLLTASLSFTSTIYYPIEAFTELLGREAANMIKYNPASLASDAARSIVAGALPVDQIASLLAEALAAIAVSLTVILKHHSS